MRPEHLFDQAAGLLQKPAVGAPRQADLRRSVSATYYGVFHGVLRLTARTLVGWPLGREARYGLIYRSVPHARVKAICLELPKRTPKSDLQACWPPNGFGADIQAFASTFVGLYRARHLADYDPFHRISLTDASEFLDQGRAALNRLGSAPAAERDLFATLLVANPRE